MPAKTPPEITETGMDVGATKARTRWDKLLVAGFLGGAYIAFGGLLAIVASAGMRADNGLITLVTGLVFSLGLVLVVVAGSELLTGNMALVPMAALGHRASLPNLLRNFGLVFLGNLIGALFVAYFLAWKTGVIDTPINVERLSGIATGKALKETDTQVFLRAVGCNWLVCLAVWMALAAEEVAGKILAIIFPITAFVALGFDHVVANMFFLPLAIFADVPAIGWGDVLGNWVLAFAGNLVGAGIFVGGFYWYLYGQQQDTQKDAPPGDAPPDGRRRFVREGEPAASGRRVR
jgi:formate/nitrite transporter